MLTSRTVLLALVLSLLVHTRRWGLETFAVNRIELSPKPSYLRIGVLEIDEHTYTKECIILFPPIERAHSALQIVPGEDCLRGASKCLYLRLP